MILMYLIYTNKTIYIYIVIDITSNIKCFTGHLLSKTTSEMSYYSNSIVPGGLLVRSYITLFTPLTSLIILLMTF